jgi:quinol monooxygenase YgiN
MSGQVKILAVHAARPGKIAELQELLEGVASPSRAEPGDLHGHL